MTKKLLIIITILALQLSTVFSLAFANQTNHGQKVSEVAKSTEPGPEHGKIVSEAARNKSIYSYALDFDGIDDYVDMPDINIPDTITIAAWIKTDSLTEPDNNIVAWTTAGNEIYYKFATWGNRIVLGLRGAWNSNTIHSWWQSDMTVDSNWHHIAVTQTGNEEPKFYIDGINVGATLFKGGTGYRPNDTIPLSIGKAGAYTNPSPPGYQFKGIIDQVQIWNKVLSQNEIEANLFNESNIQDGLIGYWKFNEGSGDTAHDSSGNGNHGTIYGDPQWVEGAPVK